MTHRVGIIIGSLRKQSLNRKMANALIALAPAELKLEIVEIGQLPHCNADDEANPPAAIVEFKRSIDRACAGHWIIVPTDVRRRRIASLIGIPRENNRPARRRYCRHRRQRHQ